MQQLKQRSVWQHVCRLMGALGVLAWAEGAWRGASVWALQTPAGLVAAGGLCGAWWAAAVYARRATRA